MDFTLRSPMFDEGDEIPARYTCDGAGVSPPLEFHDAPPGTRSLVLLVEDPDAPGGLFTHWLLYNLPVTCTGLPEGIRSADLPFGAREGINSWKRPGYGGPCPPSGRHRYVHRLFALDVALPPNRALNRAQLLRAVHGHVLAESTLVATYARAEESASAPS